MQTNPRYLRAFAYSIPLTRNGLSCSRERDVHLVMGGMGIWFVATSALHRPERDQHGSYFSSLWKDDGHDDYRTTFWTFVSGAYRPCCTTVASTGRDLRSQRYRQERAWANRERGKNVPNHPS